MAVLAFLAACAAPEAEPPPASADPGAPISYVDAVNGRDTNDGRTARTAFQTLERATRVLKPGWTVKVMNGTYTSDGTREPLVIDVSGAAGAPITFVAESGHRPVIQIPRGAAAWSGIHILASWVIIDGLEVVGQGESITAEEAARNDGTQAVYNHNCIYVDGVGFGS